MEIIRLDDTNLEAAAAKAAAVLRDGGIVLYPTDTLYGLGVDALNPRALSTMRELKGREKKKPISILVSDIQALPQYVEMHETARALAERIFPGPLTLVLTAKKSIPEEIQLNGTIGIRIPDDPFCATLAHAYRNPITATSANRSAQPVLAMPHEILGQFGHLSSHIDLIIDGGPRASKAASTVVLYTGETPYILREGALSREDLGI